MTILIATNNDQPARRQSGIISTGMRPGLGLELGIDAITTMENSNMDISIPIAKLNQALAELAACDFTEDELRAECEHAIDNALPNDDSEPDLEMYPGGAAYNDVMFGGNPDY